jgi:hypothetical protein
MCQSYDLQKPARLRNGRVLPVHQIFEALDLWRPCHLDFQRVVRTDNGSLLCVCCLIFIRKWNAISEFGLLCAFVVEKKNVKVLMWATVLAVQKYRLQQNMAG